MRGNITFVTNIIIAGSRDIDQTYEKYVFLLLDTIFEKLALSSPPVIFSGKAKGMDSLGEAYAKFNNWEIRHFPADWNTLGKKAGPVRNQQMIDARADILICFYFEDSKGSKDMITRAAANKIKVISHMFKRNP